MFKSCKANLRKTSFLLLLSLPVMFPFSTGNSQIRTQKIRLSSNFLLPSGAKASTCRSWYLPNMLVQIKEQSGLKAEQLLSSWPARLSVEKKSCLRTGWTGTSPRFGVQCEPQTNKQTNSSVSLPVARFHWNVPSSKTADTYRKSKGGNQRLVTTGVQFADSGENWVPTLFN